jgi:AAA family ATP:ADP antiporter
MARPLERLLNLQPGDTTRGFLLFAYLFLVMSSYMAARIARDAIFLDDYLAVDLAYVDLSSALLIGVVVAGYLWVGRHLTLPKLLAGSLLVYTLNLVALWYIATVHDPPWLSPVIYIWVSLFGALAPVQVWTLANYVLTTREAKRVFGLIGSGAILGAVVGARLSSLLARRFGAESLLIGVAIAMLLCAALVPFIWRRRNATGGAAPAPEDAASRINVVDSLRKIAEIPYLRAIALLILVANITTSLGGWQFKALAKFFIPQKNLLAAFFGDFYFYAGILGFLVQLAVTGRLLRRFGLGPALLIVPVAFVFGSTGVLLWGSVTIWAAIGLRSCINVLQYSVDKPSVELLYLPVAAGIKNQVKSFIDTVVWRFGDGLAAVAVLAFGKGLGWPPARVSWVVLVLVIGWIAAAIIARRLYVDTLRASIHDHRLDSERASAAVLDRSMTDLLAGRLASPDPREVVYALNLFAMGRQSTTHPAIHALLDHPAPEVRARAVSLLNDAQDTTIAPRIDALLLDEDLGVRAEAMRYLARHANLDPLTRVSEPGGVADYAIRSAVVAYLARPGRAQNLEVAHLMLVALGGETGPEGTRARLEAARLLAHVPDQTDPVVALHAQLLTDEDAGVAREAVRAVARHPRPDFLPRLLDLLTHSELAQDAAEVLARMGTPAAAKALNDAVLEGDTALRFRVIAALNTLHQTHPELERDRPLIDTVLSAEIFGHYRSYQLLGAMGDRLDEADPVVKGLRESMPQEVERIFRLLALLHPHVDLHSAYYGVQSDNQIVHDNALEFLDNVLEKNIRRLVVPLVDSTVSIAERSRLAGQVLGIGGATGARG